MKNKPDQEKRKYFPSILILSELKNEGKRSRFFAASEICLRNI
jgi:hypothetical protein